MSFTMNTVYCRRASREHIKRKSHTALLINLSFKMLWQRRHFKQTLVFLAWGDGINKKKYTLMLKAEMLRYHIKQSCGKCCRVLVKNLFCVVASHAFECFTASSCLCSVASDAVSVCDDAWATVAM